MHSGSLIGVAKKWSLMSNDMKCAPLSASDIVLLNGTLVSSRFVAGELVSLSHNSLSPLTVMCVLCASCLSGR